MRHRIWQSGSVTMDRKRPQQALRTAATATAIAAGCTVTELAEQPDRRTALAITGEKNGDRVAALVILKARPGEPRRVDWLLAAACTRPWSSEPAVPLVDLAGLSTVDRIPADPSGCLVGRTEPIDLRDPCDRPEMGVAVLTQLIRNPDRSAGILLTTQPRLGTIGGAGLVTAFLINEDTRVEFNAQMPTRGLRRGQARLYPAPCDELPDVADTVLTFWIGSDLEVGIDQLVHQRAVTPLPQPWASDPTVQQWWNHHHDPGTAAPAAREEPPPVHELAEARQQIAILHRQKKTAEDERDQHAEQVRQLRAELVHRETTADLVEQIASLHQQLDCSLAAYDELEHERDELLRRWADAHGRTTSTGEPESAAAATESAPPGEPAEFASFAELLEAARSLPGLRITADPAPASALDDHVKAATWRRKSWDALLTLSAYASARSRGVLPSGITDARTFAQAGGHGVRISANIIKSGETDTISSTERYRAPRTFPVDVATDPTGRAFFGPHIALERFKSPAPRLHFLDDLFATGVIYIGYLGAHLPNPLTN